MEPETTLLVTGGAGFIGSNFVLSSILGSGLRVVNLDKLTYAGNPGNLEAVKNDPRHVFVQGDIADRALVGRLLREYQPSALVNFAAESHVDRSIDSPGDFIQTNIVGTYELLEAARGYLAEVTRAASRFRFVQVSTDEVYGSLGANGHFTEESAYAPNSPYAASKTSADVLVRAYHHTFGLPTITTNCSNNYGPYQFPEKLIPVVILNALEGKPIPIYGDGKNVRDWLYVGDHCDAIRLAIATGVPGATYVFGGRAEKTNLEIVHTICALLDELCPMSQRPAGLSTYADLITFVKDRPGHDRRYAVDPTKAERELHWSRRHDFADGLRATVKWYLENRAWCAHIADGGYRRERIGLGGRS